MVKTMNTVAYFGMLLTSPMSMDAGLGPKQELYRQMKKDPKTGEWVLYYHFHT